MSDRPNREGLIRPAPAGRHEGGSPMRFSKFRASALAAALMLVLAAIVSAAPADAPAAPASPGPAWDALKSLQGEWEGFYNGTMKTRITYRLVSNGTALME